MTNLNLYHCSLTKTLHRFINVSLDIKYTFVSEVYEYGYIRRNKAQREN